MTIKRLANNVNEWCANQGTTMAGTNDSSLIPSVLHLVRRAAPMSEPTEHGEPPYGDLCSQAVTNYTERTTTTFFLMLAAIGLFVAVIAVGVV